MEKVLLLLFTFLYAIANDFTPSLGVLYDEKKAELGKKIFFDRRLSDNQDKSCETCHNLYWDFSGTIRSSLYNDTINPPTILSVALNHIYFKNGSAKNLHHQVTQSITSNMQLGIDEKTMTSRVASISEYKNLFSKIYQNGITFDNIVDSIVEFEKALTTTSSRFDKYLMGDENAMTNEEKKGLNLFKDIGCVACHNGINLGTNLMQQLSFYQRVFNSEDLNDNMFEVYRVPTLRNISRTAPYMLDGSITQLKDAIKHVADTQLMHKLSDDEIELIYKFLLTLNGEYPRILK